MRTFVVAMLLLLVSGFASANPKYKKPQAYKQKKPGPQTKEECKALYPKAPLYWKNAKCIFYDNRRISGAGRLHRRKYK